MAAASNSPPHLEPNPILSNKEASSKIWRCFVYRSDQNGHPTEALKHLCVSCCKNLPSPRAFIFPHSSSLRFNTQFHTVHHHVFSAAPATLATFLSYCSAATSIHLSHKKKKKSIAILWLAGVERCKWGKSDNGRK